MCFFAVCGGLLALGLVFWLVIVFYVHGFHGFLASMWLLYYTGFGLEEWLLSLSASCAPLMMAVEFGYRCRSFAFVLFVPFSQLVCWCSHVFTVGSLCGCLGIHGQLSIASVGSRKRGTSLFTSPPLVNDFSLKAPVVTPPVTPFTLSVAEGVGPGGGGTRTLSRAIWVR